MSTPKISFIINREADIKNAVNFITRDLKYSPQFVKWFLPKKLHYLLNKKITPAKRNQTIRECTKKIYKTKAREIEYGANKTIKNWKIVESAYFVLVKKIFKNHPWPKGKYIAIASIYHMFPRDIKYKTFYFPFTHKISKYQNFVIAHEMLHFIFFDYLKVKYGLSESSKLKNKKPEYIWQISEAFNNVIENWKPYYQILKIKGRPYPGVEKIYQKMKKQWSEKQDINWLLDQWL